jgi:hypothetical protein
MKNVRTRVEGHMLTITVDLSNAVGPSVSGKTIISASSPPLRKMAWAGRSVSTYSAKTGPRTDEMPNQRMHLPAGRGQWLATMRQVAARRR